MTHSPVHYLRALLADGHWHPHHRLLTRAGMAIPPEIANRAYERRAGLGSGSATKPEAERVWQGRKYLAYQALWSMIKQGSVLRRKRGDTLEYWLLPAGWKRHMENAQYLELPLDTLTEDPDIQPRDPAEIDPAVAPRYARDLEAGAQFPPVIVFRDAEGVNWLADGAYRLAAHRLAKRETIGALVSEGTKRDAILFACGANEEHGAERGEASRKRVVLKLLQDEEWSKESDHWIAKRCLVAQPYVHRMRISLSNNQLLDSQTAEPVRTAHRTVKGKQQTYPMKTGKIGRKKKPPPVPESASDDLPPDAPAHEVGGPREPAPPPPPPPPVEKRIRCPHCEGSGWIQG